MERLDIYAIADQRNFQIVNEDFQAVNGLTALYKNVPCQLYIHFFNEDETPFAEQFFTLKGWSMVIADDFSNATAVQLRAEKVEPLGGNTLKVVFSNVNTVELAEVLGDSSAVKLGAEIVGSANGSDAVVWQFNIQIRNRREDNTQPTAIQGNYYTKAETQGLVAGRVEKVQGMGLSSNDFTDEYKEKLDSVVTAYDDTEIKADIAELDRKKLDKADYVPYDDSTIKESISNLDRKKLDKAAYTPYDDTAIKADIQEMQGGITSLANTVNGKADVSALENKADKSELFSKEYAELKNAPDLTVYATKEQVGNIKVETDLSNYVGDVKIKTATQDVITVDGSKIKIGDARGLTLTANNDVAIKGKMVDIQAADQLLMTGGVWDNYIRISKNGVEIKTQNNFEDRLCLNGNGVNSARGIVVADENGLIGSWMLNQNIKKQTVYDSCVYLDYCNGAVNYFSVETSELQILNNQNWENETLSTFEIWIKPQMGDIDTLSFSTDIQLIGDIPTNLQYGVGDTVYVFVVRCYYNSDKHAKIALLNFAYSFNENQYYRDQQ